LTGADREADEWEAMTPDERDAETVNSLSHWIALRKLESAADERMSEREWLTARIERIKRWESGLPTD
jgi:hypothetical protein